MTFQDVLDLIADNIIDNTNREITPEVDRTVRNAIVQWVEEEKVQKVTGKGLSTEDYTTTEKTRLSNAIVKDVGIELDAGKGAKFFDGDLNTLTETGFYKGGFNVTNKSSESLSTDWYIVINRGDDTLQLSFDNNDNFFARNIVNGGSVIRSWSRIIVSKNYDELLDKINKLTIDNIDLSDPDIWTPSTKTLDLSSKVGVGILNFNNTYSGVSIQDISEASPAVVQYSSVNSANLFQNDQLINFDSIEGGTPYTDLNSGDYMIKNINNDLGTFEVYESDGVTPVSTLKLTLASIDNVTTATEGIFTVNDASQLADGMLIELDSMGGMPTLNGNTYVILELSGTNFKLFDNNAGTFVNTTGMTYSGGGVVLSAPYSSNGSIVFKDGIIDVNISKITGLENGKRIKFTANENNQIEFNKKSFAVASTNDIVGSESLILEENNILELLKNKDINWMKSEFEAS